MDIKSIAIIGAGSAGLAAAKYLVAEKKFSRIDIYEQRAATGGVWNTSRHVQHEPGFSIPRTAPTSEHEYAALIVDEDDDDDEERRRRRRRRPHVELVSPVYDNLETNIPHGLMSYTDLAFPPETPLFPEHGAVLAYLQRYGRDVEHLVALETQVQEVKKVAAEEEEEEEAGRTGSVWRVTSKDLTSGAVSTKLYDAVVAASGHYSDPFVPDVPGIAEFEAAHPGSVIHSKFYRRPEQFTGKKVLVVGNSASGIDISRQIATTSQLPVLISEKDPPPGTTTTTAAPPPPSPPTTWSRHVGQIAQLLPSTRSVRFSSGHVEEAIDAIVFCTGYHYAFPFLTAADLAPSIVAPDGTYADHLWEHMLYSVDPSLAFLVIPKRIVPFPFAEAQMAVVARMWAGRLDVPTEADMDAWVRRRAESCPPGARHTFGYPEDVDYINRLHALSAQARLDTERGLENGGAGKEPPYWDEETSWVRSKIFAIKVASRELGERRKECKTLVDLGFDYIAEKEKESRKGIDIDST